MITFNKIEGLANEFTFSATRNNCDAQYDIIAIPASPITVYGPGEEFEVTLDGSQIINQIATEFSDFVYDIQLLPYCPIQKLIVIQDDGTPAIDLAGAATENRDYQIIDDGNSPFGFILYPDKATFTFDITKGILPYIPAPQQSDYEKSIQMKLSNECDIYRLCSPNYNGQFEFSVAKNGFVSRFNVDCLYQPNLPYIHVNPNFRSLYGSDFDDARGLICSGDFSLPRIDDKFIDYQIQNKNFENIFQRQIQSMDVMRGYQRTEEILGMIGGVGSGAASGALSGAMMGGPGAAIAGAAIGGIGSLAAGVGDVLLSEGKFKEQKSLSIDLFNMNVGNIKALPYSINKVNPITPNNKIWPFIEKYSCTDEERESVRNKIIYNGMTVGRIDRIESFIDSYNKNFIQGQLIRLEGLDDDTHLLNAIYEEIKKGVYI